ncbi:hypothetical protein SJAV_05690 [Sulfurisphaera javensis]|uniref:Uncharacterized protein n=1 Tax=Sulfurisphaera javensis TaxID=2049879 RepID=A0AAT9GNZ4_9CREN
MKGISNIIFAVVVVILLIIAAIGFYEYSTVSSKYSSLQSSYSSLSMMSSKYMNLSNEYMSLQTKYNQLAKNYSALESMYNALQMYLKGNESLLQMYQSLYMQAEHNISQLEAQLQATKTTSGKEGAALDVVMLFYDGIAIENPNDVTPFLAPNFTATIIGVPFAGTYTLSTFNSTWLSDFFSTYETVYFYTTALPTVTAMNNNTYQITDVVQYFVAPTNDPVYLQVFNASNIITVQYIHGVPYITSLMWKGNEVPPSAVIAGYPSQHTLQSNQVLEEYLYEINALGAEFPPNVIAQYFSPSATLVINGSLPPGLKAGTYQGLSNIENFFSSWDNYFIFVLEYLQNLLPNGTVVPPTVQINLSPSGANATLTVNDTVIFGFVNQGQPGFPAIYDMHSVVTTYFIYNSTAAEWQIVKQVWNVQMVPIASDTIYYPLGPATFIVNSESTVTVNASQGAVVTDGNIIVTIEPGTYAYNTKTNTTLSVYNFSVITFSMEGVYAPPNTSYTPLYAFAFAINGQISPVWELVTASKSPSPAITVVLGATDTWTSWTWFGGTFNGTTYVGGGYKFADHWLYGNGVIANIQFFKPVIWIFEASQTPVGQPPMSASVSVSPVYGMNPVMAYTYTVNGTEGGVIFAGNIITIIKPGSYIVNTSSNTTLKTYEFSIIYYQLNNLPNAPNGQTPILGFAYAINGQVTTKLYSTEPWITLIITPDSQQVTMWTWLSSGYAFKDPIVIGNGVVVNLTFFRPVPWILTMPAVTSTTSSTTYSSTVGYWA